VRLTEALEYLPANASRGLREQAWASTSEKADVAALCVVTDVFLADGVFWRIASRRLAVLS